MIHQYAKSTNPKVITILEERSAIHNQFIVDAKAFAVKYSDAKDPCSYGGQFGDILSISAISGPIKNQTGRWTRIRNENRFRPFKKNPIYKELMTVNKRLPSIPGLSDLMQSQKTANGSAFICTPKPFVHEGVAWLGLDFIPDQSPNTGINVAQYKELWHEVLASEYFNMREAFTKTFASPSE